MRSWRILPILVLGSACGSPCGDIKRVPEGTRFRVEVIDELPESHRCHRYKVAPGDSFEVVAGETAVSETECKYTSASGPPIGPESEFVLIGCQPGSHLGVECGTSYAVCSSDSNLGSVDFLLIAPVPEAAPTTGHFIVQEAPPSNCPEVAACTD